MSGITQYVTFGVRAYFTSHHVFKVHPHCNTYQNFVLFYSWKIFHYMDYHILVIHFSVDGHLGHFMFLLFYCPYTHLCAKS